MGKRAPILPTGYNPVGERLRRVITPSPQEVAPPLLKEQELDHNKNEGLSNSKRLDEIDEKNNVIQQSHQQESFLKEASFRIRCSVAERKRWHNLAQELTGDQNKLSHFTRAAFMLMEHAYEELKKNSSQMQRIPYPAKTDRLGLVLYEQKIVEFLYDSIRKSTRPRG